MINNKKCAFFDELIGALKITNKKILGFDTIDFQLQRFNSYKMLQNVSVSMYIQLSKHTVLRLNIKLDVMYKLYGMPVTAVWYLCFEMNSWWFHIMSGI